MDSASCHRMAGILRRSAEHDSFCTAIISSRTLLTNSSYCVQTEATRVCVVDTQTLSPVTSFLTGDTASSIEWSRDSVLLLITIASKHRALAFSLSDASFTAKVDESLCALHSAHFSPNGGHIITVTDFHVRMTLWSLSDASVTYIKCPKPLRSERAAVFNRRGNMFASVQRVEHKDEATVYQYRHTNNTWECISAFTLATEDVASLVWSGDDEHIAAVDSPLDYNIFIYTCRGDMVARYSAYEGALGIRTAVWSPSSALLAIASHDECVRIIDRITWNVLAEYQHEPRILTQNVAVYVETSDHDTETNDENHHENINPHKQPLPTTIGNEKENGLSKTSSQHTRTLTSINESFNSADSTNSDTHPSESNGNGIRAKLSALRSIAANKQSKHKQSQSIASLPTHIPSSSKSRPPPPRPARTSASSNVVSGTLDRCVRAMSLGNRRASLLHPPSSSQQMKVTAAPMLFPSTHFAIGALPYDLPTNKTIISPSDDDTTSVLPLSGITECEWSCDERFIYTRNAAQPNAVHVWETSYLRLFAVVVTTQTVRQCQWSPTQSKLAIATATDKIYLWSAEGCSLVTVPIAGFRVRRCTWSRDGASVVLADSKQYCCAYTAVAD